jgi:prephenate dehydrogenase
MFDYFLKHVGKRKTIMIVKEVAKRVHHKNEIAYTSTFPHIIFSALLRHTSQGQMGFSYTSFV